MRLPLPQVEVPARALVPPHPAIEAALAAVSLLPGVKPAHRAALAELVRCVSWHVPAQRFRVSVRHLTERLGRSDATVDRYLAALRADGWIGREQTMRQSRRHGWRPAWTWLTEQALHALGLQRGSIPVHPPKPSTKEEARRAARREHRIPKALQPLLQRLQPGRVVWLMSEARARGRQLQDVLATKLAEVLASASPAGLLLRLLDQRSPAGRQAGADLTATGHAYEPAEITRARLDADRMTPAQRAAATAARLREMAKLRSIRARCVSQTLRPSP